MNRFLDLMGLDPSEYNQWEVHWGFEDLTLVLVLVGVLIPLALWFFWTSLSRIQSRGKKYFLIALRVMAFTLLALLLMRPELEFRKSHVMRNSVAVLLDESKSMSIKTFPSEKERIAFVKSALEENSEYLESLTRDFQVDYYLVSDRIDSVPSGDLTSRYRPRSGNTDFTRVISQLAKRYSGKSLQGTLLFSDGADLIQEPEGISRELIGALASIDGPIHTLQAGSNRLFKDLAVDQVEIADFGFVQQPVRLTVSISASSIGNKNIPLVLKEEDKILASKILEIREGKEDYEVVMEFIPRELGRRIYSLTVPLFAGESITSNNRKDFQIKVIRDRIRVLHLNGRPSWDSRFLREVLANNPKVDLLSFFILRTLGDDVAAPTSELSLIPFPTNLLFSDYLNSFDLIIFQNFSYTPFIDKKYLDNIRTFVKNGGAFVMVGGDLSFQEGGYDRTSIEEILPVKIQSNGKTRVRGEFTLELKNTFQRHPILQLERDPDLNATIWETLPPLNGLNIGLVPANGAQVLGTYTRDGTIYPVLVAGRVGQGRTVILATDSSWNWNFRRVGEGGSGRYYHKFWNNVIAWLTEEQAARLIQLETDKEIYNEEEEVLVRFNVLKEDYNPAPGEKVRLTIRLGPEELKNVELETDDNGEGVFQMLPEKEGFYKIRLNSASGKSQETAEINFGMFSDTVEFQKPRVRPDLLKRIAEISGGTYRELTDSTDLKEIKIENPKVLVKTRSKTINLWNNWGAYGALLTLLFFDWWVRRRSGLS